MQHGYRDHMVSIHVFSSRTKEDTGDKHSHHTLISGSCLTSSSYFNQSIFYKKIKMFPKGINLPIAPEWASCGNSPCHALTAAQGQPCWIQEQPLTTERKRPVPCLQSHLRTKPPLWGRKRRIMPYPPIAAGGLLRRQNGIAGVGVWPGHWG